MDALEKFELADMVRHKALELASRAMRLAAEAETEREIAFAIAMLDDSESSVRFWVNQLKAEVRS